MTHFSSATANCFATLAPAAVIVVHAELRMGRAQHQILHVGKDLTQVDHLQSKTKKT